MGADFRTRPGTFRSWAPKRLQAAATMPLTLDERMVGRIEVTLGRLGTGKTTFAVQRCLRLARCYGFEADADGNAVLDADGEFLPCLECWDGYRDLYTTGEGWGHPWRSVTSWEQLFALEHCVLLVDELPFLAPSVSGLLGAKDVARLQTWMALLRKRHVCLVGSAQHWTRISTQVRHLVDVCWVTARVIPGRLHTATAHDRPEEGGAEVWAPVWFNPRDSQIPTNAGAWVPYAVTFDPEAEPEPVPRGRRR